MVNNINKIIIILLTIHIMYTCVNNNYEITYDLDYVKLVLTFICGIIFGCS